MIKIVLIYIENKKFQTHSSYKSNLLMKIMKECNIDHNDQFSISPGENNSINIFNFVGEIAISQDATGNENGLRITKI